MKAVGALPSGISNGTPSQNNDRDYLLKISIPLIDDVLGGGLRPSEIVSIAGDNATDRILVWPSKSEPVPKLRLADSIAFGRRDSPRKRGQ